MKIKSKTTNKILEYNFTHYEGRNVTGNSAILVDATDLQEEIIQNINNKYLDFDFTRHPTRFPQALTITKSCSLIIRLANSGLPFLMMGSG